MSNPFPRIIDLPYQPDCALLFERIRHLPGAIWLDSGKPRSLLGRNDIMAADPQWLLETREGSTVLRNATGETTTSTDCPFTLAHQLLERMGTLPADTPLPFAGGLMGFFSYDLGRADNGLPQRTGMLGMPRMRLGWYGWAVVINHQTRTTRLVFHPACDETTRRQVQLLLNAPVDSTGGNFCLTAPFAPHISEAQYRQALARIDDYIHAGDCYQVNFTQPLSATFEGDLWTAYKLLRQALPAPFGAFMRWDDKAILCCSPERFIKLSQGHVETKPIKGTIARGRTIEEDEHNAVALMNSIKDRAENLMIVDLLRNDLGRSCQPGSIRVPKLFALESFANVHHLVSTVTGKLAPGEDALSLLRKAFPGGSITGAPKKRAMEIIEELECQPRELYCGSIGYISATGRMDTNIAIRTVQASGNRLTCWGGGGIVADSEAGSEYRESLQKVGVLMKALESVGGPAP